MIRNLIWDVDGTLFDTYPAIVKAFLEALGEHGVSDTEAHVDSLAKAGLSKCAHALAVQHGLAEERLAERFGELYGSVPKASQPPFAGVWQVCRAIVDDGGINAIATHRTRASTEALLATHAMRELFTEIVAGDEGFAKKPEPAMFMAILDRCGLDPGETAAIGDRRIDILAGKAAGLRTCLFQSEGSEGDPDLVFTEYSELLDYLKRDRRQPASR